MMVLVLSLGEACPSLAEDPVGQGDLPGAGPGPPDLTLWPERLSTFPQ